MITLEIRTLLAVFSMFACGGVSALAADGFEGSESKANQGALALEGGALPTSQRSALQAGDSLMLEWERAQDLPDPAGLKGMFSGVSHGRVLLVGGSNFPVPRNKGGQKEFARQIFTCAVGCAAVDWRVDETLLEAGMAEGASVTTEEGVVMIGGSSERGASASVRVLSWDCVAQRVRVRELASLPEPLANVAAVYWRGKIFVAGGENGGRISGKFWMLDGAEWRELPAWPGAARFGAVMAALKTREGERLFLFCGRKKSDGAVKESDYLADGFAYDPESKRWAGVAPMPHRSLQAAAFVADENLFVVMGGSDGHDLGRMAELGARYRLPDYVMIYDAIADCWRDGGKMPLGVGAASVVAFGVGRWLVAGGEYSPALRTRNVYLMRFRSNRVGKSTLGFCVRSDICEQGRTQGAPLHGETRCVSSKSRGSRSLRKRVFVKTFSKSHLP